MQFTHAPSHALCACACTPGHAFEYTRKCTHKTINPRSWNEPPKGPCLLLCSNPYLGCIADELCRLTLTLSPDDGCIPLLLRLEHNKAGPLSILLSNLYKIEEGGGRGAGQGDGVMEVQR